MCEHFPSDPKAKRIRPTLVILDYVQLLQGDDMAMTDRSKTAQVTAAIEGAKNLAVNLDVPVVMAVQAGRQTDSRGDYMPTMSDAQWASAIEQACDVVLGVHRPIRRDDLADQVRGGQTIRADINGQSYVVNDQLMVVGLVKQRAGKGAGRYPVYLDPVKLEMHETMRDPAYVPPQPEPTHWADR
jgi:replicative DNA helicase